MKENINIEANILQQYFNLKTFISKTNKYLIEKLKNLREILI
jgi:hypothetical protein